MDNSKINQTELSYSCTAGSSNVNIFTGRLLFDFLNLSMGCGDEKISVSHIYNSLFELPTYLNTNMSSNWKLNVQQYLYKNEDNTFTYIDGSGRKHLFELLDDGVYYDTSGLGYELEESVLENRWIIKDLKQNRLIFVDNKIYKIKLKDNIVFEYSYDSSDKLVKILLNDIDKVTFNYNDNNLLSEMIFEDEKIKYYYNDKNQLVGISKVKENYEKKIVKFTYTDNLLTLVTSLIDRTSLRFKYWEDSKISEVRKEILPHHIVDELEVGLYFGEEVYSGEEHYTGEEEKIVECGYNKFTYNINGENSTRVSNEKFIIYKYYYNQEGKTLSVFEVNPKKEKELISLQSPIGKTINLSGKERIKINGKEALKFNAKNTLEFTLNYEDLKEKNIICCMWINLAEKMSNNKIKVTLNNDNNYSSVCNYDVKGINSWQQLFIPINSADLDEINKMSVSFIKNDEDVSNKEVMIADLRVYPSSINKLILKNGENEEELVNVTKLIYTRNKIDHTILLNGNNYITAKDLEQTFLNQIVDSTKKVLYINNGAKKVVFDTAELKSDKLISENMYFNFNMYLRPNSSTDNKYIILTKTVDNSNEISSYYEYKYEQQLDENYTSDCICYFTTDNNGKIQKKYLDKYGKLLMKVNEFGVKIINKYDDYNGLLISQIYDDGNNRYETKYLHDETEKSITKILSNKFTTSTFYDNMYINVEKEQQGDSVIEYDHSLFKDKLKKVKFNNNSENIIEYDCDHRVINLKSNIDVDRLENTPYGYHFEYDEYGKLKKYFLTSGENNQNEMLLFKTIHNEDSNCFYNYYSKNGLDTYFNVIEYDKYGRIASYKGENTVYIKKDSEFGLGRVQEVTEKIVKGIEDIEYNHKFEYDDTGNISKYTVQKDGVDEIVIKDSGNLKEYNFNSNEFIFALENGTDNALSNLISKSLDNNIITEYEYDSLNRIDKKITKDVVEGLKYYNNTKFVNSIMFTKPKGNMLAYNSATLDDSMKIIDMSYTYKYGDFDDQLSKKNEYKYNSNNQLCKEFSSNLCVELGYIYSEDGSLQEVRKYDNIGSDKYSVYKKYKYDKGRLISLDIDNRKLTFYYDEYGNCTYYTGMSLAWNKDRLLSKIVKNGDVITYKYDCFGNRTEKSIKLDGSNYSSVYKYYYDLNGKLIFEDRGYYKLKYNYDITGLNGFTYYQGKSSNTYIYLKDILGNIFALVDESTSNIVVYYEYDAWGEHRVWDNTNSINTNANFIGNINPFRYRGYYYDTETNLFLVSSRYYSPELGRFIQPADVSSLDPQSINGLNLYTYALNNPIAIKYDSFIDFGTSSTGASNVSNQTAPEWFKLLVGALPDLKVGLDYLKAHGTKSSFAYATAKTYRFPILGGTHSAFTKGKYSYGDLVGASFRKITTDSARGGFGVFAKKFATNSLYTLGVNFVFNFYENNWQIDDAMVQDTLIDTAIGVSSYYMAAGTMSLLTAGALVAFGWNVPGLIVVGGVVVLSIAYDALIRWITGYDE